MKGITWNHSCESIMDIIFFSAQLDDVAVKVKVVIYSFLSYSFRYLKLQPTAELGNTHSGGRGLSIYFLKLKKIDSKFAPLLCVFHGSAVSCNFR
jgi:hypothetical protein